MACDVPYVLYTLPECLRESEGEVSAPYVLAWVDIHSLQPSR